MSFYKDLVKKLNKENTVLLEDGGNSAEFSGWIDTGSYILNALVSGSMYGGIPDNKITAIAGPEASGKSYFALGLADSFMKRDNAGVNINDTESAITRDMMIARGIDPSRLILTEPSTVQEFRTSALSFIDNYLSFKNPPPMMMILDSLGQLSTSKEIEDTTAGKETKDMSRAALIKATFRVLNLKLAKAKIPMIVTNHVYDAVGSFFPTKELSGGSGLKYTASIILFLMPKKDRDGTEVIGNIIKVSTMKSRFTRQNKSIEVKLSYTHGLDRYYGLFPIAEKYGIFTKVGKKYEVSPGVTVFENKILKEPTRYYTPEVMEKLEKACATEFKYGPGEFMADNDETDDEEDSDIE